MATTDQQARNSDVVRQIASAVSAGGDLDALDDLLADDYVEHNAGFPSDQRGSEVMKRFVAPFRTAFPNLAIIEDDLFAVGNKVVYRHRAVGTHEGEFMGIAPTGNDIEVDGIAVNRFEDGRAAEKWVVVDALGLLRQLGAAPEPPHST